MPSNPPAGTREDHSAIYDSQQNRMLVFGSTAFAGAQNDVQGLTLGATPAWQTIAPGVFAPPSLNLFYAAFTNPAPARMVVFGGQTPGSADIAGLYEFHPGPPPLWEQLSADFNPPPIQRVDHSAIYSPPDDAIIIFGGRDPFTGAVFNEMWRGSLTFPATWQNITPASTPAALSRYDHSAIYDPLRRRMIVFGGFNAVGQLLNDTWAIDLSAPSPNWVLLDSGGSGSPTPRYGHTAIYDPNRDDMVMFGGDASDARVWFMRLQPPEGWYASSSVGADPLVTPRAQHSAVYDYAADRMIVFGGGLYRNDVWAFNFIAGPGFGWHLLAPSGPRPSPRAWHTATMMSPAGMVVFGGFGGEYNGDVMALNIPTITGVFSPRVEVAGSRVRVMPNPARGYVDLEVELGTGRETEEVRVFDVAGRVVWQAKVQASLGRRQRLRWDGRVTGGAAAPAGVYLARVGDGGSPRARVILLR
jgi:hypothetical protein